jgi:5-methylcytosine-specific restriction enzyme A
VRSRKVRLNPGYRQAIEHIRLIQQEGYALKTFAIQYDRARDEQPEEPSRIAGFEPELVSKTLLRGENGWFAT